SFDCESLYCGLVRLLMATSEPPKSSSQNATATRTSAPASATADIAGQGETALPSGLGRRMRSTDIRLTTGDVQVLQRLAGNQAVQRLLANQSSNRPSARPIQRQSASAADQYQDQYRDQSGIEQETAGTLRLSRTAPLAAKAQDKVATPLARKH